MLIEHFSLNKMLNMDIFVRVKIEDNRIDFSSLLGESSWVESSFLKCWFWKNVMRIFALLCPHNSAAPTAVLASQSPISIFDSPNRLSKVLWGYWRRTASKFRLSEPFGLPIYLSLQANSKALKGRSSYRRRWALRIWLSLVRGFKQRYKRRHFYECKIYLDVRGQRQPFT